MILLDTNALLWIERGHDRARPLHAARSRLALSPATALELQFLVEVGRLRLRRGVEVRDLCSDDRWVLDDLPAAAWFEAAASVSFTRDPFDRLIVAHARYRGWKLATGDQVLLEQLRPSEVVEL